MVVEITLAAIGTADLAIKYGKTLIELYSSYHNATEEISERILLLETNWLRTEKQLNFLERIWDKLDSDHQAIQSRILRLLVNHLEDAIEQVQKLEKRKASSSSDDKNKSESEYKRWRYAIVKKRLDATITSFARWQQAFDPTWFLTLKISDSVLDKELARIASPASSTPGSDVAGIASITSANTVREALRPEGTTRGSIFLPQEGISDSARTPIPYSTACLLQRGPKNRKYIMDSVQSLPGVDPAVQNQDVRDLARKLANTDPLKFGLLQCRGVVKVRGERGDIVSYDFMFYTPPSLKSPQSLRKVLIDAKPDISLSARFHVAQQIAKSLSYVHTYGFVHKGIRPETILLFQDDGSELATPFLLGFEKFRSSQRGTLRHGDSGWQKNLYRHPRRQGLRPEDDYIMQHDIYSLGVCLLEIGLWQTLVSDTMETSAGISIKRGITSMPSPLLPELGNLENGYILTATSIKESLVQLAKDQLPSKMGDKYTNIVVSCFTCLDESNPDFSDQSEFQDEDDITIGVRYIEKILLQLNSISA